MRSAISILSVLMLGVMAQSALAEKISLTRPHMLTLNLKGDVKQSEILPSCTAGQRCWGWQISDSDPGIVSIDAVWGKEYQLRQNGEIWQRRTLLADKDRSWRMIDNNPQTVEIVATPNTLYQRHKNGAIWQSTGELCGSAGCRGWKLMDNNPRTRKIIAGGTVLYQMHEDRSIWRFNHVACNASGCPGWDLLDKSPGTRTIAATPQNLFQLQTNGDILRWNGTPCTQKGCSWVKIGADPNHRAIFGGRYLYALTTHPRFRVFHGWAPCSTSECKGWHTIAPWRVIAVTYGYGSEVIILRADNTVWTAYKAVCMNISCWNALDLTGRITAITGLKT